MVIIDVVGIIDVVDFAIVDIAIVDIVIVDVVVDIVPQHKLN